ncbi:MAG: hypothetical protein KDN05_19280, partial [Verrucomicrobiae bacterium]|nr:hypothetical protein [Verrucomicrobiae bacterium]
GNHAFGSCASLHQFTIGKGIVSIGEGAFSGSDLLGITFLGNAPLNATNAFTGAQLGFTIYYYNGASGFTSPTWQERPTVNLGAPPSVPPEGAIQTISFTRNEEGFSITFAAREGATYSLQRHMDLGTAEWTTVASGGRMEWDAIVTFSDDFQPPGGTAFYRVKRER